MVDDLKCECCIVDEHTEASPKDKHGKADRFEVSVSPYGWWYERVLKNSLNIEEDKQ